MFESFEKALQDRKIQNRYRIPLRPSGVDFVSNDYLNLSSHPDIRKALITALEEGIPLSGRASRLLSGTLDWHEEMDERLKKFISREGVLTFSSGYLANVGVVSALARGRTVLSDELNHASLIDGIALSKSPFKIYPHKDLNVLEKFLQKEAGEKLIVTESLFSMDGDFAPLREISELALKYEALLMVDEAHATGIFGKNFSGCVSDLKEKTHIITLHTCGKALGGFGAFVGCSSLIKDYLVNYCRPFIYTTAPPPLMFVQWKAALEILEKEPFRPLNLRKKALKFRIALSDRFSLKKTESPIVPLLMDSTKEALKKAEQLREQGLDVRAIRFPSVPKEKERLRIILKYAHSPEQIEKLKENFLF